MAVKTFLFYIGAGVAATLTMDLLAIAFNRFGLTVGAKGEWVGRWYLGMLRGRFVHSDIAASAERGGEKQAALIGHFTIGIILASFYFAGARWLGVPPDRLVYAVGYGFATCVFPWFLVLPSLGFGVCGWKGPAELKLFRTTVLNHLSYGLGLWWTAGAFLPG